MSSYCAQWTMFRIRRIGSDVYWDELAQNACIPGMLSKQLLRALDAPSSRWISQQGPLSNQEGKPRRRHQVKSVERELFLP